MVVAGANVHDTKLLGMTLEAVVVERPIPTEREPQYLCLDKGYDNPTGGMRCGNTAMSRTSAASGRRNWMQRGRNGTPPDAG